MGTDLVNNCCSHLWQDKEAPPRGALEQAGDPGNDHPEVSLSAEEMGSNPLEGGRAGSVSGTMTHEGDYVVLFIAKNKNL